MSREQLANDIWRACDIMRRDNNCGGVMEYVEHLAWLLFLKFLDEQEAIFETEAALSQRQYTRIISTPYRWSEWVSKALGARRGENGRRTTPEWDGAQLMRFIHGELLPHLASLSGSSERDIIASIFNERAIIVCASPYNLKDVLEIVDGIDFTNPDDIHTVSHVYENLLRKLGQENRLAGEFYTPRPVIRFIVEVIDPQIGETVYDPACGTCGFLAEAYEYMQRREQTHKDYETLQRRTFFGHEKKPIPALLGLMNMVLHGAMAPQIHRRNTLEENIRNVSERFDVVLTNPPFGGTENTQIQQNFPVKANATELLMLEHIMKKLKAHDGARCGMVVPEGTLFRGGGFATVKQELLENFNLFMIISLPPGTFAPYSDVKTGLLFFERPGPTKEILYYEMPLPADLKKFNKGSLIGNEHFAEARKVWQGWQAYSTGQAPHPEPTDTSWIETAETIAKRGYDLSAKNPNRSESDSLPLPVDLTAILLERSREFRNVVERLHTLVANGEEV